MITKLVLLTMLMQSFQRAISAQPKALPDPYIARGACPFECCTYREWWPDKAIALYDKPHGTQVVATLAPGEHAYALTGQVVVHPSRYRTTHEESALDEKNTPFAIASGTELWLLDNEGEGYVHAWWNGRIISLGLGEGTTSSDDIQRVNDLLSRQQRKSVWWARIRNKDGKIGWTRETNRFENQDQCG